MMAASLIGRRVDYLSYLFGYAQSAAAGTADLKRRINFRIARPRLAVARLSSPCALG